MKATAGTAKSGRAAGTSRGAAKKTVRSQAKSVAIAVKKAPAQPAKAATASKTATAAKPAATAKVAAKTAPAKTPAPAKTQAPALKAEAPPKPKAAAQAAVPAPAKPKAAAVPTAKPEPAAVAAPPPAQPTPAPQAVQESARAESAPAPAIKPLATAAPKPEADPKPAVPAEAEPPQAAQPAAPPARQVDPSRRPPGMPPGAPVLTPRMPAKAEIFHEGDHVVYPTHGVGKVERIATEEIAGHKLELIHITFEENRMTLRVPVTKARSAGLRKLATRKMFDEAMNVLRGKARIKRTMWSRRAQEYEAKINSGDPLAIAEVVRDLHRNAGQPDQSFSERQIYEAAMDRLAAELAALDKTDKMTASTKLTEFLKSIV